VCRRASSACDVGLLFTFAGLWTWGGDEVGPTCAIITSAPNDLVATIDDRMPVILTEHGERLWMDQNAPTEEAMSVLTAYPADQKLLCVKRRSPRRGSSSTTPGARGGV
jgi:putative SOS response-associated peptidase YedK